MSAETGAFLLPAALDLRAAASLKADLQARADAPLEVDASKVERLGASCLQILLACAARPAPALHVTAASDAFREDARLMGADIKLGLKANTGECIMLKILTVDDSRVMRQMLLMTLTEAGHTTLQAADGQEGVEKLDEVEHLDLIITDINMPRLDGFGLIERARTHAVHRSTPILVLSTESGDDKKARAREAGASGWIVKPFNGETLLRAIRRVARA